MPLVIDWTVAPQNAAVVSASRPFVTAMAAKTNHRDNTVYAFNSTTNCYIKQGTHATLAVAPDTVDGRVGNQLTVTGHAYSMFDGPVQFTTTNALPAGLALLTDYWIIVDDANTIRVATSLANAIAGTVVVITSAGTGVHTITPTASAKRVLVATAGTNGEVFVAAGQTVLLGATRDGVNAAFIRSAADGTATLARMREV